MIHFLKQFFFSAVLLLVLIVPVSANNPVYNQRVAAYIDTNLVHLGSNGIVLQAYKGQPLNMTYLNNLLANATQNGTFDFNLDQLVRICFLANGAYDSLILPVTNEMPFWITVNDSNRDYWSENHMIQWMSADWLLHERYGKPVDSNLHYRLRHYLQLKVQYGYYEFFSSVYGPYCLSAILNLADFAQDATIKQLAVVAAQRLLAYLLIPTTDQGVFYPAAGRNYSGKYETPYGQNHNDLIYLLTGMGQFSYGSTACGVQLATSALPVDTIIQSYRSRFDTTLYIGHGLDTGIILNDSLIPTDRTLFQWSSGAYFHPDVAVSSAILISDSNLWINSEFATYAFLSTEPLSAVPGLASGLSCISESSVICGDTVVMFKDRSITLSSVQNFWKGKAGYETFPVVAAIGNTAVYTASGQVDSDWTNRSATNFNNDYPYVAQKHNVALVMYRPEVLLSALGYKHPEVSVHFNDPDFNEVRFSGNWVLGRQAGNYVGVRRECVDSTNGIRSCNIKDGQTWVIMVGDSAMYGSFNNFQAAIDSSRFGESWYLDSASGDWVYYASISIDTISISYAWYGDSSSVNPYTSVQEVKPANGFHAYPNPLNETLHVSMPASDGATQQLRITDLTGREVYNGNFTGATSIPTGSWPEGLYSVFVSGPAGCSVQKVVKMR